jgi:hypothetical protein
MSKVAEHRFLKMHPYHLSDTKARALVCSVLGHAGYALAIDTSPKRMLALTVGKRQETVTFGQLVQEARATGTVERLRGAVDRMDPVFGGTFSVSTNSSGLAIGVQHGSYAASLRSGPSRAVPIEKDLCEDILFFRRQACESSVDHSFEKTTRAYRSYVFSACSLVEAFLNRHVQFAKDTNDSRPGVLELLSRVRTVEERLEIWMPLFASIPFEALRSRVEWSDYQLLRTERNKFIHALEPFHAFSIEGLASALNLVRRGVGGLLAFIRASQGLALLGIVERTMSAPPIEFVPR